MEAKKIIDYKLVRMGFSYENTQEMFEKEVLELIKKGYIPQGGVAFKENDWFQALIKYEE